MHKEVVLTLFCNYYATNSDILESGVPFRLPQLYWNHIKTK